MVHSLVTKGTLIDPGPSQFFLTLYLTVKKAHKRSALNYHDVFPREYLVTFQCLLVLFYIR